MKPSLLLVLTNFQIGGIQKAAISFVQALKDDFEISIFVFFNEGPLKKDIPSGIPIFDGGGRFRFFGNSMAEAKRKGPIEYLRRGLAARKASKTDSFQVFDHIARGFVLSQSFDFCVSYTQIEDIHHLYAFGTPYFAIKCVHGKNKIQFIHDDLAQEEKRSFVLGALYSQFSSVFVFSSLIKERAQSFITSPIFVIGNFYDVEEARQVIEGNGSRTTTGSSDVKILMLARFTPDKGVSRLIKAISEEKDSFHKPFSVHIYGEGVEEKAIRQEIHLHHLENVISVFKPALNPLEVLAQYDALLLCSYHEAHPMVVDEAHMMGKTVLALNYSSAKEQLFPTDFLWENDQKSLQNGLVSYINNFKRENASAPLSWFQQKNEETRATFLKNIESAALNKKV